MPIRITGRKRWQLNIEGTVFAGPKMSGGTHALLLSKHTVNGVLDEEGFQRDRLEKLVDHWEDLRGDDDQPIDLAAAKRDGKVGDVLMDLSMGVQNQIVAAGLSTLKVEKDVLGNSSGSSPSGTVPPIP